jgi:hypothetical protein
MALSREQRLTKGTAALEGLSLSPEEYFVLSRVEGSPTVAEVVATSGLARADAERILDRLLEVGVLTPAGARPAGGNARRVAPTPAVAAATDEPLRDRARDRRRKLLEAQFGAGGARSEVERSEPAKAAPAVRPFEPPMVSAQDPRLDDRIPLPI